VSASFKPNCTKVIIVKKLYQNSLVCYELILYEGVLTSNLCFLISFKNFNSAPNFIVLLNFVKSSQSIYLTKQIKLKHFSFFEQNKHYYPDCLNGATTLSITTFSTMTLGIVGLYATQQVMLKLYFNRYAKCYCAESDYANC
jgi:hypothetical protein